MSNLGASYARKRLEIVRNEILSLVKDDSLAKKLIPLYEEYLLVKKSVDFHDKNKDRSKTLRSTSSKVLEGIIPAAEIPLEATQSFKPPKIASLFSEATMEFKANVFQHVSKKDFTKIYWYWQDNGRLMLSTQDGQNIPTY